MDHAREANHDAPERTAGWAQRSTFYRSRVMPRTLNRRRGYELHDGQSLHTGPIGPGSTLPSASSDGLAWHGAGGIAAVL